MTLELSALMVAVLVGGMIAISAAHTQVQAHFQEAFQVVAPGQDRPADFSAKFIRVDE